MNKKVSDKLKITLASVVILSSTVVTPISVFAEGEQVEISSESQEYSQIVEEATEKVNDIQISEEDKLEVERETNAVKAAADLNITTLTMQVKDTNKNKKTEFSYSPGVNVNNPYEGGELTGYARVPLTGSVYNRSILPINGPEHIRNWETGNYGARINIVFPEGVDAQAMFNTINWEKSNQSTNSDFYIKAIGIPTPVHLTFGLKWDRNTVKFNTATPNEFSLMLRGIKKSEVTNAEWNKYNPLVTASALTTVGLIPLGGVLGNMDGWAEGMLSFDVSKYTGNKDDITKNKELTKGRLTPEISRNNKYTINVLDESALLSGTEGIGDIGKAIVKPGHEHDNPQVSNNVPTWDSYLSIWDTEEVYNTNNLEETEVAGQLGALPGDSLFNRDLVVNKGDDFNSFNPNRFNRVINYFTKEDVTKGSIGDVNSVSISHLPTKVPNDVSTPVTYTGTVSYYNGDTRQLIPNVMNVTNNSKPATDGSIVADDYTVGDSNITGTYTGDVAKLRLYINGVSVAWGGTVKDGKFTFYAANQKISSTDVVTLNAYDKDDNLLQENAPVKINEASAIGTISPAEYSIGSTEITGTYTGDVAKARVTINGKAQAWGGTFSNGRFTYYVGNGKIQAGDTVTITAYDKNDKVLDANKPVKIKAAETQGT
ncbi:immunoglobulin-like domain-containing protein, partial [Carnobacterium maltaromaticum]|uniref:immunoglobulin-like domain-containing protein n=1 Tax=Carnobacterium maltaromaticum TaxID=2751 RepID=UPI00298AF816